MLGGGITGGLNSVDLEINIKKYLDGDADSEGRKPDARYASFDYCFNYFQSFREAGESAALAKPANIQLSCLHLGFYLASCARGDGVRSCLLTPCMRGENVRGKKQDLTPRGPRNRHGVFKVEYDSVSATLKGLRHYTLFAARRKQRSSYGSQGIASICSRTR